MNFSFITHVYCNSQRPKKNSYCPGTSTCIFCWWVQVCYSYGSQQSVGLGYPKQSSFEDIHGGPQVRVSCRACTISSIQQWKIKKRRSSICRGTSDVHILILQSLEIIHVINATLFETEETLPITLETPGMYSGVASLFFDPSGGTLYSEIDGTLYEWDSQKNEPGPEWWIGE